MKTFLFYFQAVKINLKMVPHQHRILLKDNIEIEQF